MLKKSLLALTLTLTSLQASQPPQAKTCVFWRAEAEGKGPIHNGSCGFFPGTGSSPWDAEARAISSCQQNAGESPHGERCRCTLRQPALCG